MALTVSITNRKGYKNLYLEVYDGETRIKRRSTKTTDRKLAEKKRDELLGILNTQGVGLTIGQLWDLYIVHRWASKDEPFADGTADNYDSARKRLNWRPDDCPKSAPLIDRDIGKVDCQLLAIFHDDLAKRYSGNVVRSTFSCLKQVWEWARTRKKGPEFPGHPKIHIQETDKEGFAQQEMKDILRWLKHYLNGRWFPFFMLLGMTGARASEILGLREDNIDREENTVRIAAKAKGNKAKRYKVFAVDPRVLALIAPRKTKELLFPKIRPACRDGKPTDSRVTLKVLKRAVRAVGISDDRADVLDQHSFRRSWCILADVIGVSLGVAMDQTGHKSPQVHLDYRKRTVKPETHDAVRKVTDIFADVFSAGKKGGKQGGNLPPIQAAMPLKSSEILPLCQGRKSCWTRSSEAQVAVINDVSDASRGEGAPTNNAVSTSRLSMRLPPHHVHMMDELARELGVTSRSGLVRFLVELAHSRLEQIIESMPVEPAQ